MLIDTHYFYGTPKDFKLFNCGRQVLTEHYFTNGGNFHEINQYLLRKYCEEILFLASILQLYSKLQYYRMNLVAFRLMAVIYMLGALAYRELKGDSHTEVH